MGSRMPTGRSTLKVAPTTRWGRLASLASCGIALVVLARLGAEERSPLGMGSRAQAPARLAPRHSPASASLSSPVPREGRVPTVRPKPVPSIAALPPRAPQAVLPAERVPTSASATVSVPVASAPVPLRAATPALAPAKPRQVPVAALAVWSKPGLCASSSESSAARGKVASSFRLVDAAERGKLYLDPRLPAGSEEAVFRYLDIADGETLKQLKLQPARPVVFAYFDQQLMRAAACINGDAVAFYDGALHIVASRADVLQSVVHEYTHHALFSAGMVGPAWAQEGIAMHVAGERWWHDRQLLQTLLDRPFGMDDLDRSIPYKLAPPQAVTFYVQSAVLVECVLRERKWDLRQLFDALQINASGSAGAPTYDLPELEQSSFLRACVALPG